MGFWFLAIDELMTPEEKAKLFTAIGYSDSSHHLSLPKQVSNLWHGLKKQTTQQIKFKDAFSSLVTLRKDEGIKFR